jgi:hypothetical protein
LIPVMSCFCHLVIISSKYIKQCRLKRASLSYSFINLYQF